MGYRRLSQFVKLIINKNKSILQPNFSEGNVRAIFVENETVKFIDNKIMKDDAQFVGTIVLISYGIPKKQCWWNSTSSVEKVQTPKEIFIAQGKKILPPELLV